MLDSDIVMSKGGTISESIRLVEVGGLRSESAFANDGLFAKMRRSYGFGSSSAGNSCAITEF